ncbi:hypothetical protein [Marinoscillum pacificum]|uniref:hypothetical protein n=1 Tax=Marinoscillum pacificum TaxID=392723 RepID=UPI002157A592|nr:hypothetical protein [Marinoscillum pacificum]
MNPNIQSDTILVFDTVPTYKTQSVQSIDKVKLRSIVEHLPSIRTTKNSEELRYKLERDQFLFVVDSNLYTYDIQKNETELIFKGEQGCKIIDFAHNIDGYYILYQHNNYSKLIRFDGLYGTDTLYSHTLAESEGAEAPYNFALSPTGDYVVLNMGYWEWFGIRIINTRDHSEFQNLPEIGMLTHFLKWLPSNSALMVSNEGAALDMGGPLHAVNINLDTKEFKSWKLDNTIYQGFVQGYEELTIIGEKIGNFENVLRIPHRGLSPIKSNKTKHKFSLISGSDSLQTMISEDVSKFKCLFTINGKEQFNKGFLLEYAQFEKFDYLTSKIDSNSQSILVTFKVGIGAYDYGSITYHLDYTGVILKKTYDNIDEEYYQFDKREVEYLIDSTRNIVNHYKNGQLTDTYVRNPLSSPIPAEIIYKP